MTRFFAVIPQLPGQYFGNYRPLVAVSCTRLMVIISCYYYLEATTVHICLRPPGTSWYTHYDFQIIFQHTVRATGDRHNNMQYP
jgi:hypothetical protein